MSEPESATALAELKVACDRWLLNECDQDKASTHVTSMFEKPLAALLQDFQRNGGRRHRKREPADDGAAPAGDHVFLSFAVIQTGCLLSLPGFSVLAGSAGRGTQ
jgi:hypothetical protein